MKKEGIGERFAAMTRRIGLAIWQLNAGTAADLLPSGSLDALLKAKASTLTDAGVLPAEPVLRLRALLRERNQLVHAIGVRATELMHEMGSLADTLTHQRAAMTREQIDGLAGAAFEGAED